jgi:hypothetical protein
MIVAFDVAYSLLSTCQQSYPAASGHNNKQYDCTAFGGAVPWIVGITLHPLLRFLETYEHPLVAGFTVVLAFSTVALWLSTNKLWESTRDTAAKQEADTRILQRAYIRVDPAGISPSRGENKCHPNIIIKNAGNLPAKHVRWCITWAVDKSDRLSNLPIEGLTIEGNNTLPPKAKMLQGGPIIYLGDQPHELRNERGLYLYVWGAVFFEDGFENPRTTWFCHRYNAVNLEKSHDKGGVLRGREIAAEHARFNRHGNEAD